MRGLCFFARCARDLRRHQVEVRRRNLNPLGRLRRHFGASPPLNLWVRTAPQGAEHFCWRIDILPRLTQLAGFELGTGVEINIIAPERAAAELRDA